MKIYSATRNQSDLDIFKSIAGTDTWIATRGEYTNSRDGGDWYIRVLKIGYIDHKPIMVYNSVLKEDVDNASNFTSYTYDEIDSVLNYAVSDDADWCTIVKPVTMFSTEEIRDLLSEGVGE